MSVLIDQIIARKVQGVPLEQATLMARTDDLKERMTRAVELRDWTEITAIEEEIKVLNSSNIMIEHERERVNTPEQTLRYGAFKAIPRTMISSTMDFVNLIELAKCKMKDRPMAECGRIIRGVLALAAKDGCSRQDLKYLRKVLLTIKDNELESREENSPTE